MIGLSRVNEGYSFLNCYSYAGKSKFATLTDAVSAPLCGLLGGKNVSVISQTAVPRLSTTGKVIVIFSSILAYVVAPYLVFYPLAIVFTASFIAKAANFMEKNKVRERIEQAQSAITFLTNTDNQQEFTSVVQNTHALQENPDVYKKILEFSAVPNNQSNDLIKLLNEKDQINYYTQQFNNVLSEQGEETGTPRVSRLLQIVIEKPGILSNRNILLEYIKILDGVIKLDPSTPLILRAISLLHLDDAKVLTTLYFNTRLADEDVQWARENRQRHLSFVDAVNQIPIIEKRCLEARLTGADVFNVIKSMMQGRKIHSKGFQEFCNYVRTHIKSEKNGAISGRALPEIRAALQTYS